MSTSNYKIIGKLCDFKKFITMHFGYYFRCACEESITNAYKLQVYFEFEPKYDTYFASFSLRKRLAL